MIDGEYETGHVTDDVVWVTKALWVTYSGALVGILYLQWVCFTVEQAPYHSKYFIYFFIYNDIWSQEIYTTMDPQYLVNPQCLKLDTENK